MVDILATVDNVSSDRELSYLIDRIKDSDKIYLTEETSFCFKMHLVLC